MLSDLWIRARSLLRRKRAEAELDDELRFHLERQTAKYVKSGMTPGEARRRARIEMGGMEQTKEECRDARGVRFLESVIQDILYGLRQLRCDPTFTLIAVLGLALGIAVNTTIFSVVDWALFRSLPVSHPSQITLLAFQQKHGSIETDFSYPEYEAVRRQTPAAFSDVLGYDEELDGLAVNGTAEQVLVAYVTRNFFQALGLKPAIGRLISPRDSQAGGTNPFLVLSYSYWQRHFGGDPNVLGKQVSVNGRAVTIVGVAPEGFDGINAALDIQGYLPFGLRVADGGPSNLMADWHRHPLSLLGRLRPGASLAQAHAVLQVVSERISTRHPKTEAGLSLLAYPEWEARSGPDPDHTTQRVSALFLILGALVLLLACVNVANLLFVRATVREREMAVRAALGAGRWTLVRQFLTESVLLAVLGGFAGLWLGMWGIWALRSIPLHTSLPVHFGFGLDWDVLYYTLGVALASGAIVGIVPALRASRVNLNDVLHNGGRTGSARRHRLRGVLVAGQVGASLTLLIVAGLFARSLGNAQSSRLGFDPGGVVNLSMNPEAAGYSQAQGRAFYRQLLDRARALPGVTSASLAFSVPLGYFSNGATLQIPGYQPRPGLLPPEVAYNTVTPGYFETLRIPFVRGRDFANSDDEKAQPVAIVNRAMALRFWPHEDAVGRQFTLTGSRQRTVRIVGVVENSRTGSLTGPYRPYFYLPLTQDYQSLETLQVRAQGTPETTIRELEGEIRGLAPTMPVFDVQTMSEALNTWHGLLLFRLAAGLAGALGVFGLVLALVGVYGVMSYSTSQRTHEIGIRVALGAQAGEVLTTVLRQGLAIVGVGIAIGLGVAIVVSRLVASFLVGVSGTDPLTYASVCVALGTVALLACYIPARRAMRVDPMTALRHE